MPLTWRQRVQAWRLRSVRNRLLWLSLVSTAGLAVLLGAMTFPLFVYQAQQNHRAHVHNQVQAAHAQIELRMSALRQAVESLSRNSFVVNAFIDSSGRDVYLRPTLRDFSLPFGVTGEVVLLDTNLDAITTGAPGIPSRQADADQARLALNSGRTQMLVRELDGAERLVLMVPVYYPPTAHHEGVIAVTIGLADMLSSIQLPAVTGECITVFTSRRVVLNEPCAGPLPQPGSFLRVEHMRDHIIAERPGPQQAEKGQEIDLTVGFHGSPWQAWRSVARMFGLYAAATLFALAAVYLAVGRAVRPFSGQLQALERTFRQLATDPTSNANVTWPTDDEIGRMSEAFNQMVQKNHALRSSLEARVRQRTAELAQARDEAQAASRAKSAFIATMSHEIRTPLNGVLGMNELLLRSTLDARQREHADAIRRSGKHLLDLLNDVLDLSRLEAGAMQIEAQVLRATELFADLQGMFEGPARQKHLELRFTVLPPADEPVLGDPLRLRQILVNLIGNAVKFTAEGRVSVSVAAQPADGDQLLLHFEVTDTGIGIDPTAQSVIFDAFTQADSSMSRQFGGTGLGLTICRRLAAAMHGQVGVHSVPGQGATFHIDLPVRRAPADAFAPAAPLPAPLQLDLARAAGLRGKRALVVEDNDVNSLVLEAFLSELGMPCTRARNGAEALQALARSPSPEIVLMDCQMPVLDGYEATRRWRALEADKADGRHLPIIAVTANAMAVDLQGARAAGMDDLLCKPFRYEELLHLLMRWLLKPAAPDHR